jgi:phosphatidyl-myo-inositol dimannoside synthase
MKKSLLITLEFPPTTGGIATYTKSLAEYLNTHTVVLTNGSTTTTETESHTIYTRPLFFPTYIWPRWVRGLYHIWNIIRAEQIETLLVHHILPIGTIAYILNVFTRRPYILFFHGTDVIMARQTYIKRFLARRIIRRAQACIVNSTAVQTQLLDLAKPIIPAHIHTIYPTPSDIFLHHRDEAKVALLIDTLALRGKKILLTVSRIDNGKGFSHLTRIMPTLLERIPNLLWVVIGDGPKRQSWWQQVEQTGLQSVVRYIGEIPQTELPHYYDIAHCFVLLTHPDTNRQEGAGTVFLEAMARHVPVVAGRVGGVPDVVHDRENGTLIDISQGDSNIIDAITNVFEYPEQTAHQVETAYQQVCAMYRPEKQFDILKTFLS